MSQDAKEVPAANAELVPVNDLDEFLTLLTEWHENQVLTVRHMHNIPPGTEVTVDETDTLILEGDVLKGFQVGIQTCLNYLGTLPFTAEYEDAEPLLH